MPNVMDMFPSLVDADTSQILSRRMELIAQPDPKSDETLQELVVISRILRGRASAPKTSKKSTIAPTLDAL